MAVTEIERTELANRLVQAIGMEATETLMQCIIPEGRGQLATKDDLRVLEAALRSEFHLAIARQTRIYITTLAAFMLTTWGALIVPHVV